MFGKIKKDISRLEWKRLDDAKVRSGLAKDISNLDLETTNLKQNIDVIYKELFRIRDLFAKDRHGMVRPKVDMLADRLNKFEIDVWNALNTLQKKIEKLEKK